MTLWPAIVVLLASAVNGRPGGKGSLLMLLVSVLVPSFFADMVDLLFVLDTVPSIYRAVCIWSSPITGQSSSVQRPSPAGHQRGV